MTIEERQAKARRFLEIRRVLERERMPRARRKPTPSRHGMKGTAEYQIWTTARNIGIAFAAQWDSFARFIADVGRRPTPHHRLLRIDKRRGYFRDNVRWVDSRIMPGYRFGRLTIIGPGMGFHWRCRCDCGREVLRMARRLTECRGDPSCPDCK